MADEQVPHKLQPPQRAATEHDATHSPDSTHGISFDLPDSHSASHAPRSPARHSSAPAYQSPLRHHQRTPSRSRGVKETLNARSSYGSDDDYGASVHKINQYVIKQEIGRGSFGAVHLATDQYNTEFAVKEFSKARLRKRAQSHLLRRPNAQRRAGHLAAGGGFNSPLHMRSSSDRLSEQNGENNSLHLIKEEIAIMKKLNHENVVQLHEVLDDPEEDSLYMVMEYCKKGVVMKVGLDERAQPYEEDACRYWFRDLILGIEYLHAQNIVHRDIKPDNCLITQDDVLKVVDFGVSEMFEKESDMSTTKSAGSPAFMPPELCVARHGPISARAADIWSMGVTLYCLRYGHIPFEKSGMLELYESIRNDDVPLSKEKDEAFADLMHRLLCKDPAKRITMDELREHPWVTKHGADPLLSASENCATIVEPVTEIDINHAITGHVSKMVVIMKAARKFKSLLDRKKSRLRETWFGKESRLVGTPEQIVANLKSTTAIIRDDESDLDLDKTEYAGRTVQSPTPLESDEDATKAEPSPARASALSTESSEKNLGQIHPNRSRTVPVDAYAKGHAHDPLEDLLFLNIGPRPPGDDANADNPGQYIVSESPPAVDEDIYEQAYKEEMDRILARRKAPSIYLTRRVEHREDIRNSSSILDASRYVAGKAAKHLPHLADKAGSSLSDLVDRARAQRSPEEAVGSSSRGPATASGGKTESSSSSPSSTRQALYEAFSKSAERAQPHIQYTRDSIVKSAELAQPHLQSARDTILGVWKQSSKQAKDSSPTSSPSKENPSSR